MIIASLSENLSSEKRISVTPEIAKKYISSGFKVNLCENYGKHLGFEDKEYKDIGVNILKNEEEIISNADVITQLSLPSDARISLLKENQTLMNKKYITFK